MKKKGEGIYKKRKKRRRWKRRFEGSYVKGK